MNAFEKYQAQAKVLLDNPDDPTALHAQVVACENVKFHTPATVALIRRCAAIAPDEWNAVFNLGSVLARDGKYRDAIRQFLRAVELVKSKEQQVMTLHHIGMMHNDIGENDKAIKFYELALAISPDDKDVGQSRAISWLCQGRLNKGLTEFEVRLHKPARKAIYQSGIPIWNGEKLDGKSIIITHEQGFGDTIQFIRFLPRLRRDAKPKQVAFAGPEGLNKLLWQNFHADQWLDEEGPFDADYICSPMAMVAHLGIEYCDVSGLPYMQTAPLFLPDRGLLKVGIVWQGSWSYSQNARRSMALEGMCPLFAIPGAAFYSLQVGPGAKEVSQLGLDGFLADLTCKIKDWSDTARAIMAMDVIVGVDTGTLHLAGALGKRTLMILPYAPCWRWLRSDNRIRWYENTRLFRQQIPGTWPVSLVKNELERMVYERRQGTETSQSWPAGRSIAAGRSILSLVPQAQGRTDQCLAGDRPRRAVDP